MRQTFAPILDLLDDGLRLYRRGFPRFLLLVAILGLPLGMAAGALLLAMRWLQPGLGTLVLLIAMAVAVPLSLYVMGALSRATIMAWAGQPISLRQSLAISPARAAGMGCYGTAFMLVAGSLVSMLSSACFCVIYLFVGAGMFAFAATFEQAGPVGEAAATLAMGVSFIAILIVYAGSLVVNGAVYGSAIYAMQPFVQDDLGLGAAVRRSIDLVSYRAGHNLLAFLCASLVFGVAALAATLAIGVLLPLPVLFLLGPESAVAQAITVAAWVIGVAAASPLLPIWMALLYRHRRAAREGEDLAGKIAALEGESSSVAVA